MAVRCFRRNRYDVAPAMDPFSKGYFHGKLTREQAEELLISRGCQDGLFLLRSSADGNYAVSVCHESKVLHYNVERQVDNTFQIPNGKTFSGPIELVNHHSNHLDGFLTLTKFACNRAPGLSPYVMQGVTRDDLSEAIIVKATELGYKGYQLEHVLTGTERRRITHLVLREFHQKLPWFHDELSREEAERRLAQYGHEEGAYLVRCKRADDTFVLSLSFQREPKHYKVAKRQDGRLSIEGGKPFDSLVELVDHYHLRQEGLLCKLRKPVPFPGYCSPVRRFHIPAQLTNTVSQQHTSPSCGSSVCSGSSNGSTCSGGGLPVSQSSQLITALVPPQLPARTHAPQRSDPAFNNNNTLTPGNQASKEQDLINLNDWNFTNGFLQSKTHAPVDPLPPESLRTEHILDQPWEEPDRSEDWLNDSSLSGGSKGNSGGAQSQNPGLLLAIEAFKTDFEKTQKLYDDLPADDVTFHLRREQLVLGDRLGGGNFGEVLRAVYRDPTSRDLPVAVKTLKEGSVYSAEQDILTEAHNMANLRHRHIVRLIGVCRGPTMMLVLELAPLGPINKYLKKHPECNKELLTELSYQVALGMQYLEQQKFVHRDLAARNVLLVNRCHAKISDFGMSKTLGLNNDYYRAEQAGRWPLKWYSPESIYYFKFNSKTDVWSFGVTAWEIFSYGDRPYRDKKGTEIIEMLELGQRLEAPPGCPRLVYSLMLQCWSYEADTRPSFLQVAQRLSVMPRSKV